MTKFESAMAFTFNGNEMALRLYAFNECDSSHWLNGATLRSRYQIVKGKKWKKNTKKNSTTRMQPVYV